MVQSVALNTKPTFFADITIRHPEHPNGELLFHCGNFPVSLSVEEKPKLNRHFLFDDHSPGTHEGEIKGGAMTLARFDGDHGEYSFGKQKEWKDPLPADLTYGWKSMIGRSGKKSSSKARTFTIQSAFTLMLFRCCSKRMNTFQDSHQTRLIRRKRRVVHGCAAVL